MKAVTQEIRLYIQISHLCYIDTKLKKKKKKSYKIMHFHHSTLRFVPKKNITKSVTKGTKTKQKKSFELCTLK